MLTDLFIWSLKASLLFALIYGTYWVLFKNNTRFQFRRTVLLLSLLVASIIPLLDLQISISEEHPLMASIPEIKSIGMEKVEVETIYSEISTSPTASINLSEVYWQDIILGIYGLGLLVSLSLMLIELLRLARWYYFGARRTDIQDNVITHRGIKYPFSFWKWIFVPQGTDYDQEIWKIIEKHESAHLEQGHTIDMVLCGFSQCLLWYNPIIHLFQKELRGNHEALADRHVLKFTDFNTYAKALLSVSVNANTISLGHSFALVSSLSKRLKVMKTKKTHASQTIFSALFLAILMLALGTANALQGQETKEEARAKVAEKIARGSFSFMFFNKITTKHQRILDKLKADNPGKVISYRYLANERYQEYLASFQPDQETLFFDKLSEEEQEELYQIANRDTTLRNVSFRSDAKSEYSFTFSDFFENDFTAIKRQAKYVVMYESLPKKKISDQPIYDAKEVDKLPAPIGGLSNFEKSIALDAELPNDIDKTLMPKTIDFVLVVNGGNSISELNLVTDIKEDSKEIDKIYKFMGTLHNEILEKIRAYYPWKRGVKDGKEVRVRMKIAIPTRYM
ncbi:M56 family metallopeptidase [Roseivirga sp.]|uniref:M56 family metallopeptidase n=1 Tax=Roseivirga sp. TaxID=1964215 RepID=UPI003B8E5210